MPGDISTCRLRCRKYIEPNKSVKFHKSCKNKFSGCCSKTETTKWDFKQWLRCRTKKTWRCHVVQSLTFLLHGIQRKKMKLQKNIVFSAVIKREIVTYFPRFNWIQKHDSVLEFWRQFSFWKTHCRWHVGIGWKVSCEVFNCSL